MQLNTQPREKAQYNAEGLLDVVNVWETIQGEGPFAGSPAVFVRLAGCNLQCPMCDTDYTSKREWLEPKRLFEKVFATRSPVYAPPTLVVITGGEPFRQNLKPFINELLLAQYRVQIETNGTMFAPDEWWDRVSRYKLVTIVCSPKAVVYPPMWPYIDAVKYVVGHGQVHPPDGLPSSTLGNRCGVSRPPAGWKGEVYVQPLDVQDEDMNRQHVKAAVESCMEFGYRLCLQTHKIVGLE